MSSLIEVFNYPYQSLMFSLIKGLLFFLQMDLAVDPVYRRLYKFCQLIPFVSDAQSLIIVEDIDLKLPQNIEHLSLDRFQTDYESCKK